MGQDKYENVQSFEELAAMENAKGSDEVTVSEKEGVATDTDGVTEEVTDNTNPETE